jgi:hypothetical protein
MSKHVLAILLACGIVFFGIVFTYTRTHAPERVEVENNIVVNPEQKKMTASQAFEEYVRAHIGTLSPSPAVLGGSFYVTEVTFPDEGVAVVSYEDGHIALVADVTYTRNPEGVIAVERFEIRTDTPWNKNGTSSAIIPIPSCVDTCGNGVCEEMVCMAIGCPCAETSSSCSVDCKK